jgi:hypothetical protein
MLIASNRKLNVSDMFSLMIEEARNNLMAVLLGAAVLVAVDMGIDELLGTTEDLRPLSVYLVVTLLSSILVQYLVLRSALSREDLLPERQPLRLATYLGMSLATGSLMLVGFLLFILPGIYLAGRWLLAGVIIIVEDQSIGDGMNQSWDRTAASAWPIAGAWGLLFISGSGVAMLPFFFSDTPPFAWEMFSITLSYLMSIGGWLMALGTYRALSGKEETLENIFG